MSEVSFECPGCSQPVAVCTAMSGQQADCPSCQTEIIIPHFEFIDPEPAPQAPPVSIVQPTPAATPSAPVSLATPKPAATKIEYKKTVNAPETVAKPGKTTNKFKKVEKRAVQKPKTSIMKPVAILAIAGVAIAGAVNYGLSKADKVKAEQISKAQKQKAIEEAEAAEALKEEKTRAEWNEIHVLYKPALNDEAKTESVIERINLFKLEYPNSKLVATADRYLAKLIDRQTARENTKNKIKENDKILTMNKLIGQAQTFINSKKYIEAYNVFADYNGPLAEEIKPQREEQMEYLNKLVNGQKITQEEFQVQKQTDFYKELTKSIVRSKSSAPLKKYDTPEIHKGKPQLAELIDDYKKNSTSLATYYKKCSGKSTMLSINGEKNVVKIIDADSTQIFVSQKVNNSILKRKIKYKEIDLKDKAKAISKIAPEAGALYGLLGSLRKGDTEAARSYSRDTGPLAEGFMEQL